MRKDIAAISRPHLGLLCNSDVPEAIAADFERDVAAEGLDLVIERRSSPQVYAGVEWLMPTAIIAYVAKSYFDGFLKEMGKEHYLSLKAALKSLAAHLSKVKTTRTATPGKISGDQEYSMVFSICFDRNPSGSFKFLIPVTLSEEEFDAAMVSLFAFMEAYLSETQEVSDKTAVLDVLSSARPYGGTVLLAYNPATRGIEAIDPLAKIRPAYDSPRRAGTEIE